MNKEQKNVIRVVNFGNLIEWYEIYLFPFLAPIISQVFFGFSSFWANLTSTFIIFGTGLLARLIGAVLFGRYGDHRGRKKSFIRSILLMTIPTCGLGFLPTYQQCGIIAPLLLALMRAMQGIAAAGEAPGTICFLYEYADSDNKRFMTSWTAWGNQLGAILAVIEGFLMKQFLSEEFLLSWGWRISFWVGGSLGLFGYFLRRRLHETPPFTMMKKYHSERINIFKRIKRYKAKIALATSFGVLNAVTYYLVATYIPSYFSEVLGLNSVTNVSVSLTILTLTTVLLPIFGRLGDKFKNANKQILISCAYSIIFLLFPLYFSLNNNNLILLAVTGFLCILPITCLTALLAYQIAHLFPTFVRFTGVSVSFNLADGLFGGFAASIATILWEYTGKGGTFCWLILACGLISLVSYHKTKQ